MANESASIDSNKEMMPSPADSYIGSFISLTSKYEIRYEGVLYHLNPQDSTLGLKSVRSYGTEGRRKDGPQVPPSNKVYEYILFRGSDIKDLQVKASRPAEVEEPIHNDPAIIQSKYAAGPSVSSRPVSDVSGSLIEASSYNQSSALSTSSDLSKSPPKVSGIQMGLGGPSQATQNFGTTPYDLRTHWQGYNGAAGSTPYTQQHSVSSARIPHPMQNLLEASGASASTTMAATNLFDNVSLGPSFAASNSIYLNFKPTLTSVKHSTSPTNSLSSMSLESSLPSHQTAGLNSNRLNMPSFSLASQHVRSTEASLGNNVVPDPVTLLPNQGLPPSTSFVLDSTSDPLLKQPPALVTPYQLSQPRLSEISQMQKLYPDQKDVVGSISLNSLSSVTTPAVQPPLLPLPPSAQQSQHLSQFTEEFDFEAMNEKFKKDEVWGYLGKANQRDSVEGIRHNLVNGQNPGDEDHSGLVPTGDPKPAYNKDDFFDTISRNRTNHGARNRQNQFSERIKQDSETFGYYQQRTHLGYSGGYATRHGDYSAYNWGRGYNHGGQGQGGYMRR
ncbi:Protein decapping 5 [Forsythia ovata]|uniref:Protein decapping 5 n=1 Tax=Forsythia ovata TaxID=205694 RepID=A0ABD1W6G7_9LAMI